MSDAKQLGGLSVDWELANDEARRWAQRYAGELVRGITDTTRATIQREVANFARNQESITQLSQRLAASSAFSQERARLIAVTEVTRSYSEGNQAAWRESNVVEGKMWITSVDERVCPICGPLHGVVVPLTAQFDGGFDGPPAHPRCRCDIAPAEIIDAGDTMAEYVDGEFVERQPAAAGNPALEVALNNAESNIINQAHESAYIFDKDGNQLLHKEGDDRHVTFTYDEMKKMEGANLTHNHPGGTSFSEADWTMAIKGKAKTVRAVGVDYEGIARSYQIEVVDDSFYTMGKHRGLVDLTEQWDEARRTAEWRIPDFAGQRLVDYERTNLVWSHNVSKALEEIFNADGITRVLYTSKRL